MKVVHEIDIRIGPEVEATFTALTKNLIRIGDLLAENSRLFSELLESRDDVLQAVPRPPEVGAGENDGGAT